MTLLIKNARIILENKITRGNVLVENGKIKKISAGKMSAAKTIDLRGDFLSPAFIDTHIHGYKGYGVDDESAESILKMSLALRECGVCAFCPTLYARKGEKLFSILKNLSSAAGKEKGAKIIGLHLEGPFISPERLGAMNINDLAPITKDLLEKMHKAANGKIAAITAAPELDNFSLLQKFCDEKKIVLQAGHTNATYEQMLCARQKGLKHITHLFNAQSPIHQRAPGVAGAGLMADFSAEIIADNVHVHPALLGFLSRIKNPRDIVLITDSLTPTGQNAKKFYANGERIEMRGGAWRRAGEETIVGSSLTMLNGVKNLVAAGSPLPNAVLTASTNPARLHGLKNIGKIEEGYDAKLVSFDKNFNLKKVLI